MLAESAVHDHQLDAGAVVQRNACNCTGLAGLGGQRREERCLLSAATGLEHDVVAPVQPAERSVEAAATGGGGTCKHGAKDTIVRCASTS